MSLFHFFKGKEPEMPAVNPFPALLGAAAQGTFVTMSEIPDNVFSAGILGRCCGIAPAEGKVFAPADGKIVQLSDTLHAIGMESNGIEILIHVGIDTVDMNGDGFSNFVKLHQKVKKGDLLLTMDLDKIHEANHPTTVIMAVTNTDEFSAVEEIVSDTVAVGDDVLRIRK